MKLRMIRFSGLPVSKENLAAYDKEFKERYDAIQAESGLDMLEMHKKLQALDTELQQKWQQIEQIELPKTAKAWRQMIQHLECPIMLATSSEDPKELVFVIMDQPLV